MLGFLKNLVSRRSLGAFRSVVSEINEREPSVSKLSSEELRERSLALREAVRKGESLENILPDAFSLVREASRRTLGQRQYDVQLIGGLVLHKGAVAEMSTGEGKTLAAVAPAYLNALQGEGVHVVTVNEYLARRDAVWMGQVYRALGLSVACLVPNAALLYDPTWKIPEAGDQLIDKERDTTGSFLVQHEYLRPVNRREAYLADITYGTNHEFGFDYLRDNLAYDISQKAQRGHHFAIIDEVDSILIDEARTPLIISAPDVESSELYKTFTRVVSGLQKDDDFAVDEKLRTVLITPQGIEKVEKMLGLNNLYSPENLRLVHYLEESLKARSLYHRDKDYVVRNGEVLIVDEFTGRLLLGRRYNGGLHQAIEAKEGVRVQEESRTYGKISIQNYFRMYKKVSGMTGTAQTSAEEFHKTYKLEVFSIPTNRAMQRADSSDIIYKTAEARWNAVVSEVREKNRNGQPVLLGTTSITKNELLSELLSRANIPHKVLNAKKNEEEGATIAQAGRVGAVTVATNMAGRGVDIILGGNPPDSEEARKVRELGGLHVIGTERHEARRIDNQLRGRSGRQGDPGSSQFFLSLEDDLLRIFGGDRIKGLMETLSIPDNEPIQVGMVARAVAQAQAKVEGSNFDLRKHLLEYDDVLNKQRIRVYGRRDDVLASIAKNELANIIFEATKKHLDRLLAAEATGDVYADPGSRNAELKKVCEAARLATEITPFPQDASIEAIESMLIKRSTEASMAPGTLPRLLTMIDLLWMNHLEDLEALNESVGLRAYGQRDPLVEYREEAHHLFEGFWVNWNEWVFTNIFKLADAAIQEASAGVVHIQNSQSTPLSGEKVGRNDPCPCGAKRADGHPIKYKHCHGK
ncbi:MAG: preprotein translocase subunit SecA [Patescibacteria group bacterium]